MRADHRKGWDIVACNAGTAPGPACAVVVREINTGTSAGKKSRVPHDKRNDAIEVGTDSSPTCAMVCREIYAATSRSKEICATHHECVDIHVCQSGIDCCPTCTVIRRMKNAAA